MHRALVAIEAEMIRLGANGAIVVGRTGSSPDRDAPAAAGLDVSAPVARVEQVLYDLSASVSPSVEGEVTVTVKGPHRWPRRAGWRRLTIAGSAVGGEGPELARWLGDPSASSVVNLDRRGLRGA